MQNTKPVKPAKPPKAMTRTGSFMALSHMTIQQFAASRKA